MVRTISLDTGCSMANLPRSMPDKIADGADQVLVHREVVIHVELHHRHDAAEIRG